MTRVFALTATIAIGSGCSQPVEPPLVIATTWPAELRREIEAADVGESGPILWVAIAAGENLADVCDRRGGVDLLLGGPESQYTRLADDGKLESVDSYPWRIVRRPYGSTIVGPAERAVPSSSDDTNPRDQEAGRRAGSRRRSAERTLQDPRDDPSSFAQVEATLDVSGWDQGFEAMVRLAMTSKIGPIVANDSTSMPNPDCVALAAGGRNSARARRFLDRLEFLRLVEPAPSDALRSARADGLLADLLGSALVDARGELRDAGAALRHFGHPPEAEKALGERPPWPPASVTKLMADPSGPAMAETLAEQIAPDPQARAWLLESWSRPKRMVDAALLLEIAGAADGRLVREPRFRAWLRGEWTAWSRQLYRRVARVAGGYRPS